MTLSVRSLCIAAVLALALVAVAHAVPEGGNTPREAVQGFLTAARAGDWARAGQYLDLSGIAPARRQALRPELARKLAFILDQTLALDPASLSDAPDGDRDDGLAPDAERLGIVSSQTGPVDVRLQRSPADDRRWRFAPRTVALVPKLYEEFGYAGLENLLPRPFFTVRLFEVALWQWIGLLLLVVVAYLASWAVTAVLVHALRPLVRRSRTTIDEQLLQTLVAPVRLGIALAVFAIGILALALALPVQRFFTNLEKAASIFIVAWALLRVVDVLASVAAGRLGSRGQTAAAAMVPLGNKVLKAVILIFAVLAVLQNVGVNVTGLLAGLGIGGLAVALAAQKTVENLFGGVTLSVDQPVRVGDFCRFGDKIGTVEEVGLRSTRVRTLDRTVVTIPNAQFSSLQLENFSKRDRIWLHTTLGLRYETTPDQLRHVLVEIRKILYGHPKVDPDPGRIRFVGFGAYSLDCEIFAYVLTRDFGEFLAIQEDIFLRIMDAVAASGTSFAFPSQTLYLGQDGGLDQARSRAAEAQVRAWRAQRALFMPEFPPEQIATLQGTLDYPPDGAAVRPQA